jgi:hypothetical protein
VGHAELSTGSNFGLDSQDAVKANQSAASLFRVPMNLQHRRRGNEMKIRRPTTDIDPMTMGVCRG